MGGDLFKCFQKSRLINVPCSQGKRVGALLTTRKTPIPRTTRDLDWSYILRNDSDTVRQWHQKNPSGRCTLKLGPSMMVTCDSYWVDSLPRLWSPSTVGSVWGSSCYPFRCLYATESPELLWQSLENWSGCFLWHGQQILKIDVRGQWAWPGTCIIARTTWSPAGDLVRPPQLITCLQAMNDALGTSNLNLQSLQS